MKVLLTALLLLLTALSSKASSTATTVYVVDNLEWAVGLRPLLSASNMAAPSAITYSVLNIQAFPPFLVGLFLTVPGVFLVWYVTDEHVATRQAIWGAAAGVAIVGTVVFFVLNRSNAE